MRDRRRKRFYRTINAGVHRGAHELAARSTMAFEEARAKVARLVGASFAEGEEEIVVTSGATAGLNLLATRIRQRIAGTWGRSGQTLLPKPGDEIVVSKAEHHSVLLPFQELAVRTGATLKWFDLDSDGRILSNTADEVITERTKIVAVTHVGNTTGAITDHRADCKTCARGRRGGCARRMPVRTAPEDRPPRFGC